MSTTEDSPPNPRAIASILTALVYWQAVGAALLGFWELSEPSVAGGAWVGLIAGLVFGPYLVWLATRGRELSDRWFAVLLLLPGGVAALVYGGLAFGGEWLTEAMTVANALASLSVLAVMPDAVKRLRVGAWLFLPVVLLLHLQCEVTDAVYLTLAPLLIPTAIWIARRHGSQGVLVTALGTGIVVRQYWIGPQWSLAPWPWSTLAIVAAAGVAYARPIATATMRWSAGWLAPFLVALVLQTSVHVSLTDRLSLAFSGGLLLRVLAFQAGLFAASDGLRLRRIAAGILAATGLVWIARAVLPAPSPWLGAEIGEFAYFGLAIPGPVTLAWTLLLVSLGALMAGTGTTLARGRMAALWSSPAFLIGLMAVSALWIEILDPGGGIHSLRKLAEPAIAREIVPVVAFAAGRFCGRAGIATALGGALVASVLMPLVPVWSESSGRSPLGVDSFLLHLEVVRRVDPIMPLIAFAMAWLGRRTKHGSHDRGPGSAKASLDARPEPSPSRADPNAASRLHAGSPGFPFSESIR